MQRTAARVLAAAEPWRRLNSLSSVHVFCEPTVNCELTLVIKWIASFLLDRSQSTKVNGECSLPINITRSTVQGSVTGPYAFLTYVSNCKVLGILNFLMKYADDF